MAPKLTVVPGKDGHSTPPRTLGKPGSSLWQSVMAAYEIADAGGLQLLCLACEAMDRAEALREQIDHDGVVTRTKGGLKDHPALKHELANRAFVARTLQRLGLDVEAVKPVGRPGSSIGVTR